MPTICSAICKAMRVGDNTVGTSTNCSADCGSGTRERDGHGEKEILGTTIICSAIGKSRNRKVSVTFSTICGEDQESAPTVQARQHPQPRAAPPCPASQQPRTEVLAGPLGGEAHLELGRVEQLVPLPRSWWQSSGSVERGVAPKPGPSGSPSPCTGMSTTGLSTETGHTKRKRNLVEPSWLGWWEGRGRWGRGVSDLSTKLGLGFYKIQFVENLKNMCFSFFCLFYLFFLFDVFFSFSSIFSFFIFFSFSFHFSSIFQCVTISCLMFLFYF